MSTGNGGTGRRWVLVCLCFAGACASGTELPGDRDATPAGDDGGGSPDVVPDGPADPWWDPGVDRGGEGPVDPGGDTRDDGGRDSDVVDTPDTSPGGGLCDPCETHEDCGGPQDYCLQNSTTGEVFCGQDCSRTGSCPAGYTCYPIDTPDGTIEQCAPDSETCGGGPEDCDPPCGAGQVCRDGRCVAAGDWEAEQQHCVDEINRYRATLGLGPLRRDASLEACATEGAQEDSSTGIPHGHFSRTSGCGIAYAENEIPGWPLSSYGSVTAIIDGGLAMMWAEGPGGGHYEIMRGPYRAVGCGIYLAGDAVWVVNDFG